MCSISMGIDTRELGNACKNCGNCKHCDTLEDGMMLCFIFEEDPYPVSMCYVCNLWKGKL